MDISSEKDPNSHAASFEHFMKFYKEYRTMSLPSTCNIAEQYSSKHSSKARVLQDYALTAGHIEGYRFSPVRHSPKARRHFTAKQKWQARKVTRHWALMMFAVGQMTACLMCAFSSLELIEEPFVSEPPSNRPSRDFKLIEVRATCCPPLCICIVELYPSQVLISRDCSE